MRKISIGPVHGELTFLNAVDEALEVVCLAWAAADGGENDCEVG